MNRVNVCKGNLVEIPFIALEGTFYIETLNEEDEGRMFLTIEPN